jgi:endonuclease/exonuclease/phosphatase (EEP) superfamily protein YafD
MTRRVHLLSMLTLSRAALTLSTASLAALWLGPLFLCTSCDLLNLARPLWLIVGVASCVLIFVTNHRRSAVAAGLAITIGIGGLRVPFPQPESCGAGERLALRIVSFNLGSENSTPEAAAAWIRQRPDAVILLEAKNRSRAVLGLLRPAFPHQVNCHPRGVCSTFILTRAEPVISRSLARGDVENRQSVSAAFVRIPVRNGFASILGVHHSRPWPLGRQQAEASKLQELVQSFGVSADLIVAGDFNASEDMQWLKEFGRRWNLKRLATASTWPSGVDFVPPFLAIDHVLVGSSWKGSARTGPYLGSDHRPLVASLCNQLDGHLPKYY